MGVERGVGREGGETGRGSRGRVTVKLRAKRSATNVAVACAARATHTHTQQAHTPDTHTAGTHTPYTHTQQSHTPDTHQANTHTLTPTVFTRIRIFAHELFYLSSCAASNVALSQGTCTLSPVSSSSPLLPAFTLSPPPFSQTCLPHQPV